MYVCCNVMFYSCILCKNKLFLFYKVYLIIIVFWIFMIFWFDIECFKCLEVKWYSFGILINYKNNFFVYEVNFYSKILEYGLYISVDL